MTTSPIHAIKSFATQLENVDIALIEGQFHLIEKLSVKDQYKELSVLCNNKLSQHPDWARLSGMIRIEGIKQQVPKKFSESVQLRKEYLNADYVKYVEKYADKLDAMINHERDYKFDIFAVETLAKSYLHKHASKITETPQYKDMRQAVYAWFPSDINGDNLRSILISKMRAFNTELKGTPFYNEIEYMKKYLPQRKRFTEQDEIDALVKIQSMYEDLSTGAISTASTQQFNAGLPVCGDIFTDEAIENVVIGEDKIKKTKTTEFAQLASCFVADVPDTIEGLARFWSNTALVSKQSGGWGQNYSKIRHSEIGASGNSTSGIVPWIGITGKILSTVDQGGKRKGSGAMYIRDWHLDVFEFLDMKKATGPEEARARDAFYALCICDEFMNRVFKNENWTLMCPKQADGLDELWGEAFSTKYRELEFSLPLVSESGVTHKRIVKARDLWERIYMSFAETSMPYIFYIDNANKASNHDNIGPIKLSNLCMEITLHTDDDHISSCNLAAMVLDYCVEKDVEGKVFYNRKTLEEKTRSLVRILNQVIDRTHYPAAITQIRYANMRNRPLGIGIIGLADVFYKMDYIWDSPQARQLNEEIAETMYYAAFTESSIIAEEIGSYETFIGSPANRGIFQFEMRGHSIPINSIYDWETARIRGMKWMRNSHLLAHMPTASSAGILGKTECFEPPMHLIFTRRVLSGEFVIANKYLVSDLQKLNLWNTHSLRTLWSGKCITDLIEESHNPSVKFRLRHLAKKYVTAFNISQKVLSDMDIKRSLYVCQSTSWNAHMKDISYQKMTSLLFDRWRAGSKTGVYYVRQPAKVNPTNFSLDALSVSGAKIDMDFVVCDSCCV